MTNEHEPETHEGAAAPRQESDFARLERAGAEAMARRPAVRDDRGRLITDPGQEQRAPEERSTVHQALLDKESLRRGPDGRGAPR